MRSPRSRLLGPGSVAAALAATWLLGAAPARADDKEVCSKAYDDTQALRRAGKLQEARAQAAICLRDVCAEFVRTDCAKWVGELDASVPTVVFEVKDTHGQDTTAARVTLDGKPWPQALDGTAKQIDPGQHALRFEIDGAPAADAVVQIREGEKNRLVSVSFQKEPPPGAGPVAGTPAAAPPEQRSIAPWIVGGIGVAGLAVGGITGALVLSKKSDFDTHCKGSPLTCDPQGASDASSGKTLGPISTVGFVVGGLGIGVATVMLVTRKPNQASSTTVGLTTSVTSTGGGWHLEGTW